jgi:flavin reductase (DIM6/NTAB) family NADH-FMN oxidoreductase RutF
MDAGGKADLMGLAWWSLVSYAPPMVAVAITKNHYTRLCLDAVPEFALCFPAEDQAKAAWKTTQVSGRHTDKFEVAGLRKAPAARVRVPLVEGCVLALECIVDRKVEVGDHVLYIAEIVALQADEEKRGHLYSIHMNKLVGIDAELNVKPDLAGRIHP